MTYLAAVQMGVWLSRETRRNDRAREAGWYLARGTHAIRLSDLKFASVDSVSRVPAAITLSFRSSASGYRPLYFDADCKPRQVLLKLTDAASVAVFCRRNTRNPVCGQLGTEPRDGASRDGLQEDPLLDRICSARRERKLTSTFVGRWSYISSFAVVSSTGDASFEWKTFDNFAGVALECYEGIGNEWNVA